MTRASLFCLIPLLGCTNGSNLPLVLDQSDGSLALPERSFATPLDFEVTAPTAPAAPIAPTFAACDSPAAPSDVCFPFPMDRNNLCGEGQMTTPLSAQCRDIAVCRVSFPDAPNVIFVDAAAVTDGDGSHEHPFRTIQAGIDAAPADGTVQVQPGRYEERLRISRNVTVEGACPTTTLLTMTTYAPLAARELVSISGRGSFRGFRLAGDATDPERNWGGVLSTGANTVATVNGLLLEHLAFGIYVDPGASAVVSDVRSRRARWVNNGTLNAERVQLESQRASVVHFRGETSLHDALLSTDQRVEHPIEGAVGINAPPDSSPTGRIECSDIVILNRPGERLSSYGFAAGGDVRVEMTRAAIEADYGLVLHDRTNTVLSEVSVGARSFGVFHASDSPLSLTNGRLYGLSDERVGVPSWDGFQIGFAAADRNASLNQVTVSGFHGNGIEVLSGLSVQDLWVDRISRAPNRTGTGWAVYGEGGAITAKRVHVQQTNNGIATRTVNAEDVVIEQTQVAVSAAYTTQLRRFLFRDISLAGVAVGPPFFAAVPTSPRTGELILEDGVIRNARYGVAVKEIDRVELTRVELDGTEEYGIYIYRSSEAQLVDVAALNPAPIADTLEAEDLGIALVSIETPCVAERFISSSEAIATGGIDVRGAPFRLEHSRLTGGFFGVTLNDVEDASSIDVDDMIISRTQVGAWVNTPALVEALRHVRFEDVLRTTTLATLPVPETDIQIGLKPNDDTPLDDAHHLSVRPRPVLDAAR